jgi:hypothetical protein
MNGDEMISVGERLPRLTAVQVLGDRKVRVTWEDGGSEEVDLRSALAHRKVFAVLLNDDAIFASAEVGRFGDCINWGGDAELSAVWIEELVRSAKAFAED